MNGIIGMTDLTLETELNDVQREFLSTVRLSAQNLLQIVNDILDFSRIEAGKLTLNCDDFEIRRTLSEIIKPLALPAHEKALELLYFVDSKVPEFLRGDAARLRQILINLLGNSLKFTRTGEVELRCFVENIGVGLTSLHFVVRDTGIGIAEAKQKEIFAAFTQADSSITKEFGGTGLGLAITAQLVNLMDGQITVESQPNAGSKFHVVLPFKQQLHPPLIDKAAELQILENRRVLIVDDNGTNLANLEAGFNERGMAVHKADSAEAALSEIERAPSRPRGLRSPDCGRSDARDERL